jgi:hypothetical protein
MWRATYRVANGFCGLLQEKCFETLRRHGSLLFYTYFSSSNSPPFYITCFILHLALYYFLFAMDCTFGFCYFCTFSIADPLHSHTLPQLNTSKLQICYQYTCFVLVAQLLYFAHIPVLDFRATIIHITTLHKETARSSEMQLTLYTTRCHIRNKSNILKCW